MAAVLIAEDNPDHQRLMARVLRRLGHDVTVADDGWAALVAASHERPDLIIADVDMPEMDGLQLCRALREDVLLAAVPILLVTAFLLPGDSRLKDTGAVAVVRKPFDIKELSAVLEEHLNSGAAKESHGCRNAVSTLDPAFVEAMLGNVDAGLAACDIDGRLMLCNDFLRDFHDDEGAGAPVKEWVHRLGLGHHDGRPLTAEEIPLLRALGGDTVRHAGLQAVDRHGRRRWLTINAVPVRDDDGTVIGAVSAVHDVSTAYRSRVYQLCKNDILKALALGPGPAAAADSVVRILATALGWRHARLWQLDPVIDRLRPVAVYTAEGHPELPLPTSFGRGCGLAGSCWRSGEIVWTADIGGPGSPVLPEVAAAVDCHAAGAVPVRSGDRVTGVLTFYTDDDQEPDPAMVLLLTGITDTVGASWEQRRADELERSLASTTDEYIALVGHELRTPMTSIAAYVELLSDSPELSDETRDLLGVVDRNAHRLRYLIEQLLDLAAIETGHLPIAADDVNLADVVAAAVAHAATYAAERDITVEVRAPGTLMVTGDAERLTQMLHGLLDNALKYSHEQSTVTVVATTVDGTAQLTVADTGIGLPADDQAQLFRRLYRGDNARHSGIPGSGLGLAMSRAIVERQRGTITLAPNKPAGTTVTVRLPGPAGR
ncbi:ATP-binding protein [Actinoplanes sp. NPDC051343]|uniref:ATP-binding protein n=1 Tax=Actinoplanes sp. NPDC051343 TaxID=3363906 RepID=UPI003789975A